jgi:hypothetical protein
VTALTDQEALARAHCQDLYARFKAEFIDIFEGRPAFLAPVVRIKTREGERTRALFPPYVRMQKVPVVIDGSHITRLILGDALPSSVRQRIEVIATGLPVASRTRSQETQT